MHVSLLGPGMEVFKLAPPLIKVLLSSFISFLEEPHLHTPRSVLHHLLWTFQRRSIIDSNFFNREKCLTFALNGGDIKQSNILFFPPFRLPFT